MDERKQKKIIRMFELDLRLDDIAEATGLSYGTVRQFLKSKGYTLKGRGRLTDEQRLMLMQKFVRVKRMINDEEYDENEKQCREDFRRGASIVILSELYPYFTPRHIKDITEDIRQEQDIIDHGLSDMIYLKQLEKQKKRLEAQKKSLIRPCVIIREGVKKDDSSY